MSANIATTKGQQLLRFSTAGSVDDGKSTLIGRLLYDSKSIFQDQYDAIEESSKRRGEEDVNLALLTDGLKAEREQGITIDVAYRYFSTPMRKFIIADTPGHIQYTRNMVTGASTCDVALILIDARQGMVEQTRRHAIIAHLLQIPHVIVCINKMDLVDYDQEQFTTIQEDFIAFNTKLGIKNIAFIPISALKGDNVVDASTHMPWYNGKPLLNFLERVELQDTILTAGRMPVQYVIRPQSDEFHDYRGYTGRIASGSFTLGEQVTVLPSGLQSIISKIHTYDKDITTALTNASVSITLQDDVDISRGDMIVSSNHLPTQTQDIEAMVCWFEPSTPLTVNSKYIIKHTTQDAKCVIKEIAYRLDINELIEIKADNTQIKMNEIARIKLKSAKPLFVDSYADNRITGSFVLVDEYTNNTVGAGMVV